MTRRLTTQSTRDNLKRESKRWLTALRADDRDARARFERANPNGPAEPGLRDVQHALALEHGRSGWTKLVESISKPQSDPRSAPLGLSSTPPFYKIDWKQNTIEPRQPLTENDWDTVLSVMKEMGITGLNAAGQMTDDVLERCCQLDHVTRLELCGSTRLTDAGLALIHQFPVFKTWQGGEIEVSLMSPDAEPNHLLVDGPFTNRGLASIAGLDGLFGLSFFWHVSELTSNGLEPLADLPNLGFLGCEGRLCDDEAMHHIAAIPGLRKLMAQGAVAGDAGFAALSRSQTIEFIWGRECPSLQGIGFAALAAMPALRGLAVSCKNVDDTALSMLPRFPALREFMPMDVSDAGFRHVGRCERLEALWCMYCRNTGGTATGHIAGLSGLKSYYAGSTQITDRSLEILGRMPSLERLEFWHCAGITDEGLAHLAGLPRLREISLNGLANVTREGATVFPAGVPVNYSP